MRAPAFWWRRPGWQAAMLAPLSAVYGAVAAWRLRREGMRASVPVICVGNPTVGGAGKTPTAIALACLLAAAGRRPAFLTRGYGGRLPGPVHVLPSRHTAVDVGDEPLLLAQVAPTIVARDRAAGARAAEALGADVLVMDDGFQNPSLAKDLVLLVVDGQRGLGNGCVVPAGPLRAPLAPQLDRAHALIVIGDIGAAEEVVEMAVKRGLPVLAARLQPEGAAVAGLGRRPLLAYSGIGDPQRFLATLASAGLDVRASRAFPDHHCYTHTDAQRLLADADVLRLDLVTTEKDLVRLDGDKHLADLRRRSRALPVRTVFADEGALRRLLLNALAAARGA